MALYYTFTHNVPKPPIRILVPSCSFFVVKTENGKLDITHVDRDQGWVNIEPKTFKIVDEREMMISQDHVLDK